MLSTLETVILPGTSLELRLLVTSAVVAMGIHSISPCRVRQLCDLGKNAASVMISHNVTIYMPYLL